MKQKKNEPPTRHHPLLHRSLSKNTVRVLWRGFRGFNGNFNCWVAYLEVEEMNLQQVKDFWNDFYYCPKCGTMESGFKYQDNIMTCDCSKWRWKQPMTFSDRGHTWIKYIKKVK